MIQTLNSLKINIIHISSIRINEISYIFFILTSYIKDD